MTYSIHSRQWRKTRLSILERDGWTCHYCYKPADTVDHVIPRSKWLDEYGDVNNPENLVAACKECNFKKNNRVFSDKSDTAHRELFSLSPTEAENPSSAFREKA